MIIIASTIYELVCTLCQLGYGEYFFLTTVLHYYFLQRNQGGSVNALDDLFNNGNFIEQVVRDKVW